jgi:chaperonin cofactor prefoldin
VLCHPDKVNDEFKDAAHDIFIELRQAYELNDLKKVNEILNQLENNNFFKTKSETILEKDLLKVAIAKLRKKIKILESEIIAINESETYQTIISIEDWDDYFKRTKENLQQELENLKNEINTLKTTI